MKSSESDEWCGAVAFVDGEVIDGDCERKRAEVHVFDFHLATDEFLGVVDYIVLGYVGADFECYDEEDAENCENDKGYVTLLHALKIELLLWNGLLIFFRGAFSIFVYDGK